MSLYLRSHESSAWTGMKFHDYMREHGKRCPESATNGPFQWVRGTDLPFFEYFATQPELVEHFHIMMQGMRSTRKHWTDWYPIHEQLLNGYDGGDLVVDVGGGNGTDLERFLKVIPSSKGHLILQDLPEAIATIRHLNPGIKAMSHDFMTPQPVQGMKSDSFISRRHS